MKKRMMSVLSVAVASAMLLGACGKKEDPKPAENKEPKKEDTTPAADKVEAPAEDGDIMINVIAKGFQHKFWMTVSEGAKQAETDLGVKIHFEGPEGESSVADQVQMFNNAIGQKPNAIALAALDTEALIDGLNEAKNANIPVIGFDSGVPDAPEGSVYANASTDNEAAAALGAEELFKLVEDKVKAATAEAPVRIGVGSQEVISGSIIGRTKGFIDRIVELTSALDNVDGKVAVVGHDKFKSGDENGAVVFIDLRVAADINDEDMKVAIEALLNEDNVIGVFGTNEQAAKGMILANESKGGVFGKDKIVAVGFDAGKEQLDVVRSGVFSGSITQDPFQIGYKAVELAVKVSKGESVSDVDTGAKWYDASNMDNDDIAALLYE